MKKILFIISVIIPFCIPMKSSADPTTAGLLAAGAGSFIVGLATAENYHHPNREGIDVKGVLPKQKLQSAVIVDNKNAGFIVNQGMAGLLEFQNR